MFFDNSFSIEAVEFKKDIYREERGNYSALLEIASTQCSAVLMYYQKDGDGPLLRCYLNRIIAPTNIAGLQNIPFESPDQMPSLHCNHCKILIGTPMRHSDQRLAFNMNQETFNIITKKSDHESAS